jgi:nitrilase
VTEIGEGPGMVAAELDLDQVANLRTRMPVWEHRRLKG